MSTKKSHSISKALVVILSMTLLFPLFVKFDHLFQDHEHAVCATPYKTHFHNFDIDCDFYNFTLNTIYFEPQPTYEFLAALKITNIVVSQYQFISEYQHLHFSLRGPPQAV